MNPPAISPALASAGPAPVPAAKLWKAAQDFEAMALGQMLSPIFETVDIAHSPFGGGDAEETWQSLLVSELGKMIASHGGIGLAQPVYQELLRLQESSNAPLTPAVAATMPSLLPPQASLPRVIP
jgi:flagellar protein FlgJ